MFLLGLLKGFASFVKANWRWLLPLLAGAALVWYVQHLHSARDEAIADFARYKAAVEHMAALQEAENKAKKAAAEVLQKQLAQDHTQDINRIRSELNDKLKKAGSAHAADGDLWRDWLRNAVARGGAMPQVPGAAEGRPESGGDSDAAAARLAIIEPACKITTADYNYLRRSWDSACEVFGCE